MTKDKRQLRAEAVERLKTIDAATGMRLLSVIEALVPDVPRATQDIHFALIDLMTDDEPSESNLAYHFATDEDFRVSVCEQAFARLSDSPEHPWEVAPWLEAGHADCGQIADMSQKGGDCVRSGGENVRECQPMRDLMDECAELERIVDRLTAERDECADAADAAENRVRELGNELANMTGSRDHWRRVASKHASEIQKLRAEGVQRAQDCGDRSTAMPEGIVWPHFEDGALVSPYDHVETQDGLPFDSDGVQKFIYTTSAGGSWQLQDAEGHMLNVMPNAVDRPLRTVKRPPVLASDGKPIEVGQVYFGLSDGKAWEVEGFDRKCKWSVRAHDVENPGKRKRLKPKWLTHEQPDSWERIASDLRAKMFTKGMLNIEAELFAKRIEKLAKEGA